MRGQSGIDMMQLMQWPAVSIHQTAIKGQINGGLGCSERFYPVAPSSVTVSVGQVMKTYHMYHTESISAESKLKDAEKQEEKQFSKSGDLNVNLLRHDDRQPRRGFVRKIEKMKEKVRSSVGVHSPLVRVGMATRVMFTNIGSSEQNRL